MIIGRGEAEVDNQFRRLNILTSTLSGMYYLFYHTQKIEYICLHRISRSKSTSFWHNRTKVRECRRFVLVQRYDVISDVHDNRVSNCTGCSNLVKNFRFNQLKKACDQIRVFILPSLKLKALQKRTVRASMLRM